MNLLNCVNWNVMMVYKIPKYGKYCNKNILLLLFCVLFVFPWRFRAVLKWFQDGFFTRDFPLRTLRCKCNIRPPRSFEYLRSNQFQKEERTILCNDISSFAHGHYIQKKRCQKLWLLVCFLIIYFLAFFCSRFEFSLSIMTQTHTVHLGTIALFVNTVNINSINQGGDCQWLVLFHKCLYGSGPAYTYYF